MGRNRADIHIGCQQIERRIKPRAGLEQQRKVAREYGNVLAARLVEKCKIQPRCGRPAGIDDGLDWEEAEIFDLADDFG